MPVSQTTSPKLFGHRIAYTPGGVDMLLTWGYSQHVVSDDLVISIRLVIIFVADTTYRDISEKKPYAYLLV